MGYDSVIIVWDVTNKAPPPIPCKNRNVTSSHILVAFPHKNENTVNIKVKFDRKVAFRVYDELNGEITEDNDGNLYTEIEIPNDYNLYNYIFSFGDEAEVLEPEEVRMQIKKMINKMAEKYII